MKPSCSAANALVIAIGPITFLSTYSERVAIKPKAFPVALLPLETWQLNIHSNNKRFDKKRF